MTRNAENDAPDPLATLITNYLRLYVLPANYGDPIYGQTHSDVAKRCGPLVAEVVRDHQADEHLTWPDSIGWTPTPRHIVEGQRLRIVREGAPDIVVKVDKVEPADNGYSLHVTATRDDAPSGLWRYYGDPT